MYYVRFEEKGKQSYGIIESSSEFDCKAEDNQNALIAELEGDYYGTPVITGRKYLLGDVRLLAPCTPSKVVAVGLNYIDHARELGNQIPPNPVLFIKLPHTVIGPGDPIVIPEGATRVDYEAEIAVVIKSFCSNVAAEEADRYILGATCLNDVTERDVQKSDGQWTRSKNYPTFCPIGPWIADGVDYDSLDIRLRLNGIEKQHSNTSNLIWNIRQLIGFISRVIPLYPGDVVTTGTPSGISPVKSGDVVEIEIEKIGILRNIVV